LRRASVQAPPVRGFALLMIDFTAKTHRRDAGRAENFKNMHGEAWCVGATRSGIFRCERCAAAV